MKVEFRQLNDILAKTVTAKAGSFDVITHERFLLMTAIHCGVKINWSKVLFAIHKDMVTPYSNQAWGFAVKICVLLKGAPDLTLGESKAFLPLKILTVKTVGTYVAKNKSMSTTAKEVVDEPAVEKAVKVAAKRRPAPMAEAVVMNKKTTVGRAAPTEKDLAIVPVQEAVPISVVPAGSPTVQTIKSPKRKLILLEETDDEEIDLEEEEKEKVEEETEKDKLEFVEMERAENQLRRKIKEVDWHKVTLPKIDPMNKGKAPLVEIIKGNPAKQMFALISADVEFLVQIREAVLKEIVSFFHSFSIRSLSALTSVSDLAAKEKQMLKWDEIDSLQTAIQRRLYIGAKYREMLLRKFFISLINMLEQLRQHKLEWTLSSCSKLFGGTVVQSGGIHSQFYPDVTSTSWVRSLLFIDGSWHVEEGADQKRVRLSRPRISRPKRPYSMIVQRHWAELCTDIVKFLLFGHLQPVGTYNPCRDIVVGGSVLDTETLHASIDHIKFEQVQARYSVDELKAALSQKITRLEMGFAQSSSHQEMVFRAETNDIRKEIQIQKAALTQELTAFRFETREGLNNLRAQLSEITAYINRGHDDKNGEESSRGPQPEDRSRPSGVRVDAQLANLWRVGL
ncbi:hypothetical protein F511_32096 [Dorcoceras hygrometricum]|uniref:Uncharacterized protein n=1 Tax=Dorcoceras hygrometricum TaxID=472368 RepID=A0A2Z7ADK4_9LAMI|nr:hypothetical protein F511_32096 [Dorcoceras hygrometricum]